MQQCNHGFVVTFHQTVLFAKSQLIALRLCKRSFPACLTAEEVANSHVHFSCDNSAGVFIINTKSSKILHIIDLLRPITLSTLQTNFTLTEDAVVVDFLSSFQMKHFGKLAQTSSPDYRQGPPSTFSLKNLSGIVRNTVNPLLSEIWWAGLQIEWSTFLL